MKTCPKCKNDELPLSDVKGYEHLCLGCEAQLMAEELEEQWNKELQVFNERTDRDLDFNEFYCQCGIDINPKDLKGLPELKIAYDDMMMEIKRYKEEAKERNQLELDLFDLPF